VTIDNAATAGYNHLWPGGARRGRPGRHFVPTGHFLLHAVALMSWLRRPGSPHRPARASQSGPGVGDDLSRVGHRERRQRARKKARRAVRWRSRWWAMKAFPTRATNSSGRDVPGASPESVHADRSPESVRADRPGRFSRRRHVGKGDPARCATIAHPQGMEATSGRPACRRLPLRPTAAACRVVSCGAAHCCSTPLTPMQPATAPGRRCGPWCPSLAQGARPALRDRRTQAKRLLAEWRSKAH
jgi:hypothetical protein